MIKVSVVDSQARSVEPSPQGGTEMDYQDKVIACEDCKKEFTHTAEDQQKYAERGFTSEPKRCRDCRQARKERTGSGPRGGGGGPRGGGRGFDHGPRQDFRPAGGGFQGGRPSGGGGAGYGRTPRPGFDVVCAACGTQTTVPFEPKEGRDVYCRDCYSKMKGDR